MSDALVDDLRQEISAQRRCVAFVGAGVSIHCTAGSACASWTGLLHDGVRRCAKVAAGLPPNWAQRVDAEIDSPDLDDLLSAAEKVASKLVAPNGGEYARWLRESVGTLRAQRRDVLEALRDLDVTLITSNYDNLIEEVTDRPTVTWMDGARVERVLRGDEQGVLHLHGHWERAESVILGIRSYEQILGREHAQAMLRAIAALRTIVFVGCGEGLKDPNLGALLKWTGSVFADSEYRRFRLARNAEVAGLQKDHPPEQRLFVLGYGDGFEDLAPFLRSLRSAAASKPPAAATGVQKTPAALPARPRCVGRDDELADLATALLAPQPEPVPVLGPPGIGKSNLALAAAHDPRVGVRYGARRTFVRCDAVRSRADLGGAIALVLGLQLGGDNEGAVVTELGSAPALLIVDNTETPWEGDTLGVEELLARLAGVAGLALVVTMRGNQRPAGVAWREPFRPTPLSPAAARELFVSLAGRKFAADPDLDRLLAAVDEVPLAITLLAAQAEGEPDLGALWERWKRERTAMLERAGGRDRLTNIELSYELSWLGPRMTADGQRLLQQLAALPAGVSHTDLEVILPREGARAAAVLRKAGLAFDEADRLRVLAPLREYIRRRHPAEPADLARIAAHFVSMAGTLGERVGGSEGADAVVRLGAEAPNVEAMFEASADGASLVKAAWGWCEFARFTGLGSLAPLERATRAAQTVGDFLGQANCIRSLGDIALARSDHDGARARYDEALPLYRQIGNLLGQANCIRSLGDIALARSDHDGARARYDEALPLYRQIGNLLGQANCIKGLGNIALARSDHDGARARYDEALLLYRQVGDLLGQANCVNGLGDIALARSDHDGARARYDEALLLYRQVGALLGQANCIRSLGDIALARSDHDGARARYDEALLLFRQVGDLLGQANCIRSLGDIALARSDHDGARARNDEALLLYRQVGALLGQANCIRSLGDIALARSDHDGARARYDEALSLYRQVGNLLGQANCINGLGDIALARSDHDGARARYNETLPLYRQVGDLLGQANCIQSLGNIALARSDHDGARARYDEALPLYRQVGNLLGQANCIRSLGDIAFARSDHDGARARYDEALLLYRQVGALLGQGNCIQSLGDIALARSDHDGARARYDEALLLYRQVGALLGQGNCILRLGDIALARSDHDGARARYSEALPLYRQGGDLLGQGNCAFGTARALLAQGREPGAGKALRGALSLYQSFGDPYPIGAAHFLLAKTCSGGERAEHRRAAKVAWRAIEPAALAGFAASDDIDPAELCAEDEHDPSAAAEASLSTAGQSPHPGANSPHASGKESPP